MCKSIEKSFTKFICLHFFLEAENVNKLWLNKEFSRISKKSFNTYKNSHLNLLSRIIRSVIKSKIYGMKKKIDFMFTLLFSLHTHTHTKKKIYKYEISFQTIPCIMWYRHFTFCWICCSSPKCFHDKFSIEKYDDKYVCHFFEVQ